VEASEREFVVNSLAEKRERLLAAVQGLTPEQRAYRPAPDCWSVEDCLEHLILVETRVTDSMERVLKSPPEPDKAATVVGKERRILKAVPDRRTRVKAPESVAPAHRWPGFDELLGEFLKTRERSIQFASNTQADLRSHFFPHMVFGDLDCYQWLVFLSVHTERRVLQIEEIQADTNYPQGAAAAVART
jgi:uncharacterized damage-inducible protein DinB